MTIAIISFCRIIKLSVSEMKLFLALAFVAVAAALPEPLRLPTAAIPEVVEQNELKVDAVKFVDSPQDVAQDAEDIAVDAVRFVDSPQAQNTQPEALKFVNVAELARDEVLVDAVRFVDSPQPEESQADKVKIADAPAPQAEIDAVKFVISPQPEETQADSVKIAHAPALQAEIDAVKFVNSPQPEESQAESVKIAHAPAQQAEIDAVRFVDSPQPEENQADTVKVVHVPLEVASPQFQDLKFNAVKFVDSPAEEILREPEFKVKIADLPAPIQLPTAGLPVVREGQYNHVKFVNFPPAVESSPLTLPILPMFDTDTMAIPQQIMDLIRAAEQSKFRPKVFVDPMLR